jgi:hypothetical protein
MGETFQRPEISKEQRNKNWKQFHQSRSDLFKALEKHYQSIEKINPYTHYNDGSWEMWNDDLAKSKILDLICHSTFKQFKKD